MQAVLRALSIQDKVNTCRSSHLDRTKKGLYFGPAGPLPVAHFGPAGPKLDADRNNRDRTRSGGPYSLGSWVRGGPYSLREYSPPDRKLGRTVYPMTPARSLTAHVSLTNPMGMWFRLIITQ